MVFRRCCKAKQRGLLRRYPPELSGNAENVVFIRFAGEAVAVTMNRFRSGLRGKITFAARIRDFISMRCQGFMRCLGPSGDKDISAFSQRENMLRLREQLVAVEEDRLAGKKGFSVAEVDEMLQKAIKVAGEQHGQTV
jgi:hypothetical protein